MKTIELVIQGIAFQALQPFEQGHICTAGEAAVLNREFADNLKGNFAKKVKSALESPVAATHSVAITAALQEDFLQYAGQYVLQPRPSIDPLSRAAHRIASDLVKEALNGKGQKPSDLADGLFEEYVRKVAEKPSVIAEAKRRVEATKSIVGATLDLDGID